MSISRSRRERPARHQLCSEEGVLVADRFLVREAIRHVNKGSVYRAVDTHTHADVIIKEARPQVAADDSGKDVRDLLRVEARALEKVAPLGVAPRMVMLFEHSEHLFLAEELVPGVSLREWVLDRIRHGGWRGGGGGTCPQPTS